MKRTIIIPVLLAVILFVIACKPVETFQPAQFSDGLGREINLTTPAQKIVSLAPSNTEILYAIGASPQMIGRDEFSDYPEESLKLPSVGGFMGKYNYEAIAALQPDLVLAAEINTPEQVKALEDLGLTVFYLANPTDLEGMYANILLVGKLSGHTTEAEKLVKTMSQRVAMVETALKDATGSPKVYYELDATDPAKPYTAGPGTFVDMLIQKAGATNIAGGLGSPWAQISVEELLVQNPDVILLGDAAYGTTPEQVAARPGWSQIKAVVENQVLPFNDDLVTLPGPRLVDGLVELVKALHPEIADKVE